jgi:hypothetical protein
VQIDPRQASAVTVISMPAYWSPADARAGMLRAAAMVAVAAAAADSRFTTVQVRGATRPPAGPDQLAMVAEGRAEEIRQRADALTHPEAVFQNVWWSPELLESRQ